MHQEEEARMTFPLRWASMLAAPVATTAQGDMERVHRGVKPRAAFIQQVCVRQKGVPSHAQSHSIPIKISKESVPC